MEKTEYKNGDTIELLEEMSGEVFNGKYEGIPVGSKGKINRITCMDKELIIQVDWENKRTLNLLYPVDKFRRVSE